MERNQTIFSAIQVRTYKNQLFLSFMFSFRSQPRWELQWLDEKKHHHGSRESNQEKKENNHTIFREISLYFLLKKDVFCMLRESNTCDSLLRWPSMSLICEKQMPYQHLQLSLKEVTCSSWSSPESVIILYTPFYTITVFLLLNIT